VRVADYESLRLDDRLELAVPEVGALRSVVALQVDAVRV